MAGPAFNSTQLIKNIRPDQLDIRKGELSGDLISGGSISAFASTGIDDKATVKTLTVEDGQIVVNKIQTNEISGNVTFNGDVNVAGKLTVDKLKVKELLTDRTFDKMYLEFQPVDENKSPDGSGLLWKGDQFKKFFVLRGDRFFASENIDLHNSKSFKIDNVEVLSKSALGTTVRKSSLREVGTLNSLTVSGDTSLADFVTFSSDQQRIGINAEQLVGAITIGDIMQDVVLNIDAENGRAKVGTYNNRPFDLTAGDMTLVTLEPKGIVTLGHEYKTDTVVRAWGKLGVNVKHPEAEFEVRGGFRFGGKLFLVDNSPPEKGNYKRGDICWNESPSENSPLGWVCIVAGSPGVWSQFGVINGAIS